MEFESTLVLSHHDFEGTGDLGALYGRMRRTPAGVYKIATGGIDDGINLQNDFDIDGSVTIIGGGAQRTVIDAQQLCRVLDIPGGGEPVRVVLQGITIRNGKADAMPSFRRTLTEEQLQAFTRYVKDLKVPE